jgi:hypothetical protein
MRFPALPSHFPCVPIVKRRCNRQHKRPAPSAAQTQSKIPVDATNPPQVRFAIAVCEIAHTAKTRSDPKLQRLQRGAPIMADEMAVLKTLVRRLRGRIAAWIIVSALFSPLVKVYCFLSNHGRLARGPWGRQRVHDPDERMYGYNPDPLAGFPRLPAATTSGHNTISRLPACTGASHAKENKTRHAPARCGSGRPTAKTFRGPLPCFA